MLEQAWGMEYVSRVIIKAHLIAVSEFVGVKTKMEDWQMDELCDQIAMEYGDLNVLEFICFCARLRSGRYETFYGTIDPMQITKSLDTFYEDRRRDINSAWEKEEKVRREREWEESRKNAVPMSVWYDSLTDEEKAQYPHIMPIMTSQQQDDKKAKRGIGSFVKEAIFGKS